jgi:hypothetical protein
MRGRFFAVAALVSTVGLFTSEAFAQTPEPNAGTPVAAASRDRMRFGAFGTLLGPSSLVGGGLTLQPIKFLEVIAWVGYNSASSDARTSTSQASAKASLVPVLARGRIWIEDKHSLILDFGAGVNPTTLTASGSDTSGNSIDYKRSGTPVLTTVGIGYGYRSAGGFRLALLGGALIHLSKLGESTVSTTGAFSATDRANLQKDLDDISDKLTRVRAYLELDLGAVF